MNKYFINIPILYLKKNNKLYYFFVKLRGKNYHLCGNYIKDKPHYILTTWSILHFLYYLLRGYIIKNLFYYNLIYSILFEIYESKKDCHDIMDIFINMISYSLGNKLANNKIFNFNYL